MFISFLFTTLCTGVTITSFKMSGDSPVLSILFEAFAFSWVILKKIDFVISDIYFV